MANSTSASSRWGCLIGALMGASGLILLFVVGYAFMIGYLPFQFFDSQKWKQAEGADRQTRLQMIEHLMRSGRLDGATRADVISLLGPHDETDYFSEWDFVYNLGSERALIRVDSEWLVIRFSPSDVVSEYRVVRD